MTRKNIFSGLVIAQADADEVQRDPEVSANASVSPFMPGSPIRRVAEVLATANDERDYDIKRLKELETRLAASDHILEIDPALIDPSPIGDRLPSTKEQEDAFVESLATYGQRVPGLVRPSGTKPGRYVIVYGRRRLAALRKLGQKFRAAVAELDEELAYIVQGIENNARSDLSFIERAIFASQLSDAGLATQAIGAALRTARPNVATMIGLARRIPRDLIFAVGSCPTIGRPRWIALDGLLQKFANARESETIWRSVISQPEFQQADPAVRFEEILRAVRKPVTVPRSSPSGSSTVTDDMGDVFATVRRKRSGAVVIELVEGSLSGVPERADRVKFDQWLTQRLTSLRAEWRGGG